MEFCSYIISLQRIYIKDNQIKVINENSIIDRIDSDSKVGEVKF